MVSSTLSAWKKVTVKDCRKQDCLQVCLWGIVLAVGRCENIQPSVGGTIP